MQNLRWVVLVWALALLSTQARAQNSPAGETLSFTVGSTTLAPGTGELILKAFAPALAGRGQGPTVEAQINPVITSVGAQLQSDVLTKLNTLNFVPFVQIMANAGGMAARALPVDYATKYSIFSLTGGASVAANTQLVHDASQLSQDFNNIANGQAPNVGGSADIAIMLGINLAAFNLPESAYFDPDRMQIYISAMQLSVGSTADQYQVHVGHYGLHGKYQLLKPQQLVNRFDLARWGGFNIGTGFTYASQDVAIQTTLPDGNATGSYTIPQVNTNIFVNYAYSGSGTVGAHNTLYTVPLEISTSLQLLYVFTLYAGGGVDFSWGTTELTANASEPTHVTLSDAAGTTLNVLNPQPVLTFDAARSPATIAGRGFFGLQINAGVVALFAQASVDTTSTVGAAAGLRIFY